jgi:hypothetical protein
MDYKPEIVNYVALDEKRHEDSTEAWAAWFIVMAMTERAPEIFKGVSPEHLEIVMAINGTQVPFMKVVECMYKQMNHLVEGEVKRQFGEHLETLDNLGVEVRKAIEKKLGVALNDEED